ncbi:unnamed protein product [Blepharisma stoltei]|uniref:Uncharacterized protein n=1 Tax=Blepharisma stoltei TaxID=1481888 RepID=A0AAU9J6C8_9CILI|nr:unnamed protein product [Blepharisma stoltei]
MVLTRLLRRSFTLAARDVKPLHPSDPKAKIPIYVNGVRTFPPTIDEHGRITYYHEFPEDWKPYSMNYVGHGWLIVTQIFLWASVFFYDQKIKNITEKEREI